MREDVDREFFKQFKVDTTYSEGISAFVELFKRLNVTLKSRLLVV
jgi:hypothetical protein